MTPNPQNLLRTTYSFGIAALLTLLLLVAASFWLVAKTQTSTEEVLKARAQRSVLTRLLSTVQDAETGQRGYLLTGEARYLEPYNAAKDTVAGRLTDLRAAFQDSQNFNAFGPIEQAVNAKLEELAQTVALSKGGKTVEALAAVKTDRGKVLMDRVRELIANEADTVEAQLNKAVHEQRTNTAFARRFSLFAGLVLLLVALGAVATIVRYTRELVNARTTLQELNTGLEERVKERTADLQRANDEIQRFAYIVSHDLRAPLVNVMGYTSELESSLTTLKTFADNPELLAMPHAADAKAAIATDLPESIGFIRSSTQKMDGLIKAILKLSREGQRVIAPEKIELEPFFESIAASVQHRLDETGGELRIARPLAQIESDRLALEQIFGNLVDNALKYRAGNRPPILDIRQLSRWGMLVIEVEDNGRGIGTEDQQRVFDLFRRAGPQDQQGEGIGLAHVRTLVRRLGGEIEMTSELGRGTTFRVTLPKKLQNLTEHPSAHRA